jgi:hypothetical protein
MGQTLQSCCGVSPKDLDNVPHAKTKTKYDVKDEDGIIVKQIYV